MKNKTLNRFPLNYMMTIGSPTKMFTERFHYRKRHVIMLIFLITSLLLMPMSFQIGNLQYVDLDQYVPESVALLDNRVAQAVSAQAQVGTLRITENQLVRDDAQGIVVLAVDEAAALARISGRNGVAFTPNSFYLTTRQNKLLQQPYAADESLAGIVNGSDLQQALSRQWFQANRLSVVMTSFIYAWLLLLISFILLLFGSAGILSMMRFSSLFSIRGFKDALGICLNCFGLPTLIAMIVGAVTGNPAHVLTAQGLTFMLTLIWVYWVTHFQDRYVDVKQQEAKNENLN